MFRNNLMNFSNREKIFMSNGKPRLKTSKEKEKLILLSKSQTFRR